MPAAVARKATDPAFTAQAAELIAALRKLSPTQVSTLMELSDALAELNAIDAALQRLHDGNYGVCIDCDDEIGYERLQAYPTAKRCHDCQEVYERNFSERLPHSL